MDDPLPPIRTSGIYLTVFIKTPVGAHCIAFRLHANLPLWKLRNCENINFPSYIAFSISPKIVRMIELATRYRLHSHFFYFPYFFVQLIQIGMYAIFNLLRFPIFMINDIDTESKCSLFAWFTINFINTCSNMFWVLEQ